MIKKLKNLKRGFTLVELMIVVAIVGILAALAVYGVSKYVKNAKTAEARDALGRMAKDAVSAYNKETMSTTAVLDPGDQASVLHQLCASTTAVPSAIPAAAKYQTDPADWGDAWACLKFSMAEPQYYQYQYEATADAFTCFARGDLDGDAVTSEFRLQGGVIGDTAKKAATYAPTIGELRPDE